MNISIVDKKKAKTMEENKRDSKYRPIYNEVKKLPKDKAVTVECDSIQEAKNLYSSAKQQGGFKIKRRGKTVIITHEA